MLSDGPVQLQIWFMDYCSFHWTDTGEDRDPSMICAALHVSLITVPVPVSLLARQISYQKSHQINLPTSCWLGDFSGTRADCPLVHAAVDFLHLFISLSSPFCLPLFLCMPLQQHFPLNQSFKLKSKSFPLSSSHFLCLSLGFSGVPEDLLPDFDLKIMPGRGIIHFPPPLLLPTLANPPYLLH